MAGRGVEQNGRKSNSAKLFLSSSNVGFFAMHPNPKAWPPRPRPKLRNSAKLEGKIASGRMSSQKAATLNSWAQTSLTICQISVINYHETVA